MCWGFYAQPSQSLKNDPLDQGGDEFGFQIEVTFLPF